MSGRSGFPQAADLVPEEFDDEPEGEPCGDPDPEDDAEDQGGGEDGEYSDDDFDDHETSLVCDGRGWLVPVRVN